VDARRGAEQAGEEEEASEAKARGIFQHRCPMVRTTGLTQRARRRCRFRAFKIFGRAFDCVSSASMKTILLLVASNVFMTYAWYGQLKLKVFEGKSLGLVILMSWGIAFFEYCLMVPANKIGYAGGLTGYQLKIIQEVISLAVFVGFAWLVLGEKLAWNYAVSFVLIVAAVWFAVAFKPTAGR
jgi:uncharacterized protein (DUF486 family)